MSSSPSYRHQWWLILTWSRLVDINTKNSMNMEVMMTDEDSNKLHRTRMSQKIILALMCTGAHSSQIENHLFYYASKQR